MKIVDDLKQWQQEQEKAFELQREELAAEKQRLFLEEKRLKAVEREVKEAKGKQIAEHTVHLDVSPSHARQPNRKEIESVQEKQSIETKKRTNLDGDEAALAMRMRVMGEERARFEEEERIRREVREELNRERKSDTQYASHCQPHQQQQHVQHRSNLSKLEKPSSSSSSSRYFDIYDDIKELERTIARLQGEQRVERNSYREGELEAARFDLRQKQRLLRDM
ncbi:hypothetical protein AB1Y20_006830 [Prymnesium parvum]|uniref:Meiosis-specific nuclear structural protein 1 n=1 Tax=Prymnesium parvum TaxID=97485 RepID=A0AB34IZG5_PRYPA